MFFLIVGNAGLMILYYILKKKYNNNETFQKVSKFLRNFFMFTLYIRIIIEAFFFILINALSEIRENTGNIQEEFSYAIAVIATLV